MVFGFLFLVMCFAEQSAALYPLYSCPGHLVGLGNILGVQNGVQRASAPASLMQGLHLYCISWGVLRFVHHGEYYTEIPGVIDLEHSAGPNQAVSQSHLFSGLVPFSHTRLEIADKQEALQQCTSRCGGLDREMHLICLTARRRSLSFHFFLVLSFGVGFRGHRRALARPLLNINVFACPGFSRDSLCGTPSPPASI